MLKQLNITAFKKWSLRIAILSTILLAPVSCAFFKMKFSYYKNENLAEIQQKAGLQVLGSHNAALQIIGHRGSGQPNQKLESKPAQKFHPIGNTRSAIQRAIDCGVDWIEVDTRSSKDGTLFLFHDQTVDAKTNLTGLFSNLTDKQIHSAKISTKLNQSILSLKKFEQELLPQIKQKNIGLILDIKQQGLQPAITKWIKNIQATQLLSEEKLILFGEYNIIKEYTELELQLGYTFTGARFSNKFYYLLNQQKILARLKSINASYLVLPVLFTSRSLVKKASDAGVKTFTYGSDAPRDWNRVQSIGVEGIIVDYPEATIDYFKK